MDFSAQRVDRAAQKIQHPLRPRELRAAQIDDSRLSAFQKIDDHLNIVFGFGLVNHDIVVLRRGKDRRLPFLRLRFKRPAARKNTLRLFFLVLIVKAAP